MGIIQPQRLDVVRDLATLLLYRHPWEDHVAELLLEIVASHEFLHKMSCDRLKRIEALEAEVAFLRGGRGGRRV